MTLASLPAGQLAPAVGLVAAGGAAGFGLGKAVGLFKGLGFRVWGLGFRV